MLRQIDIVERNIVNMMLPPVNVGANVSVEVIPDSSGVKGSDANNTDVALGKAMAQEELAYIEIFNFGGSAVFVMIGADADDATNRGSSLASGQMYEIKTRQRVCVYTDGAATIGRTVLKRNRSLGNNADI